MQSRMQQTKRSGCGAVQAQHHVSMVPFSRELLEALGLGYGHSTVLLPPAVLGDVSDAESLDDLDHHLALTDRDVSLTQFADDLFGTVPQLRHAGLLLESI
jgi:hypothetical protein